MWEGVLTFIFFPVLVWLAYLADQGKLSCSCGVSSGMKRTGSARHVTILSDPKFESAGGAAARATANSKAFYRINAIRSTIGAKSLAAAADRAKEVLAAATTVALEEAREAVFQFVSSNVSIRREDEHAQVGGLLQVARSLRLPLPLSLNLH